MISLASRYVFAPLLLVTILILLKGCGSSEEKDYAPAKPQDVSHVPDAVPRVEKRSRYGNPESYKVFGKTYRVARTSEGYREKGIASWYGMKFHGRRTSSGEPYDIYKMTAAHKTLPLPTYAKVTNLENNRSVVVKINDRGPFHSHRIIDLSYSAATKLGIVATGTGTVEVVAIDPREPDKSINSLENGEKTLTSIFLQTGAFRSEFNAKKQQRMVSNIVKLPTSINQTEKQGKPLYRVQIGPLDNVDTLDKVARQVEELGVVNSHVVVH
jgi:rare lipoprotein A